MAEYTNYRMGGVFHAQGRPRHEEPPQYGDAEYQVNPCFEREVSIVHPDYPQNGPVRFLPGEAKPKWYLDLEEAGAANAANAKAAEAAKGKEIVGRKSVKNSA